MASKTESTHSPSRKSWYRKRQHPERFIERFAFVVRLLLSLVTFLGFKISTADIKGAFLQSGPITRQIYVRSPRDWQGQRVELWKLNKLPYGTADGIQWQKTIESRTLDHVGLERVIGLSQLFLKRDANGNVIILVSKVTDDILLGVTKEAMQQFTNLLKERFEVGKIIIDDMIHFDGCEIRQDKQGNILMSMSRYIERLRPIELSRTRHRQRMDAATERETTQYRSLAATLMFLRNAVLPQASYATSVLQQMIPKIRVDDLVIANDMLKELLSPKPQIVFKVPPPVDDIQEVIVYSFSDASSNHTDATGYRQTGLVKGLTIKRKTGLDLFHPLDWASAKQKRVSYSPYGAEVFVCAEADDRALVQAMCNAL